MSVVHLVRDFVARRGRDPRLLQGAAVGALSVLVAVVAIVTDGNLMIVVALFSLGLIVASTFLKLEWGFYVLTFLVLVLDQFPPRGFDPITVKPGYFFNFTTISYLPHNSIVVTPHELHMALLIFVWALHAALRKRKVHPAPFYRASLALFIAALIFALIRGVTNGGDFVIALWEVRALGYFCVMALLTPQVVESKGQVQALIWIASAAISIKAIQGFLRYAELGFTFGRWPNIYETLTNHEDPAFMITLWVFLGCLVLFRVKSHQKTFLALMMPWMLLGFIAAQRRATYASLMASILALIVLLPGRQKLKAVTVVGIAAVVFSLYLLVFWNSYSRLAFVARQFKATVTAEAGVRGQQDIDSRMYRDKENYNLAATFRSEVYGGRGFGRPFDMPLRLWALVPRLGSYIPHNQILWIPTKMGIIGAFFFWLLFNQVIFRGAGIFRRLHDPYLQAVCAMCVVAVVNQFVVSYVDMQLTFYRNMAYLGMLVGFIPALERIDEGSWPSTTRNHAGS